jgi:plastocyanin
MSKRIHAARVVAMVITGLAAACGGGGAERPAANATADGPGTITGRVVFEGEPPPRAQVRMTSDPNCMPTEEAALSESMVVAPDGSLKNVFVSVTAGLGDRVYAAPTTPVVLDQDGCRYVPHVFGVQVGQPVEVHNSDSTLHNVHAMPKTNNEFNFGQQPTTPPILRTFDEPEIGVSIKCDVHGWMRAYGNVVEHPFYAVSDDDGTFAIKGLPPGTYTIEAWHERLGTQTQQVTIEEGSPAVTAAFSFEPEA